jgi:hypothetical protein
MHLRNSLSDARERHNNRAKELAITDEGDGNVKFATEKYHENILSLHYVLFVNQQ